MRYTSSVIFLCCTTFRYYTLHRTSDETHSTDLDELLADASLFQDDYFEYLSYAAPISSTFFTPYNLIPVPFDRVDETNFFTISKHGVTHWTIFENDFTCLHNWRRGYHLYTQLIQVLETVSSPGTTNPFSYIL